MNFYKHYIGDFHRDTSHLSLTERGTYLALMHHYYATEKPLPKDVKALCRIAGAVTKTECDAVKSVLCFFEPMESGLVQARIEAELQRAGNRADKNRAIAVEREAKRRAARMEQKASENEEKEEHEPSTNRAQNVPPDVPPDVARNSNLYQTPDTRLSFPTGKDKRGRATPPPKPDGIDEQVWRDWLQLRKDKRATVTQTVLDDAAREAGKAGMTLEAFLREWCARGSQGLKAEWLAGRQRPAQQHGGRYAAAAVSVFGPTPSERAAAASGEVIDV